jgi:L-ascorbate metabolism protein UlaG (beta-lactamase superfamily)
MLPSHHNPEGGFRNIWPTANGSGRFGDLLRWQWQRMRSTLPPSPEARDIPRRSPDFARPSAAPDELRITWIGQATFLIQIAGQNILTDPVWSERASPFQWLGPARFSPPGVRFEDLPPIHAVLISHDHYDHLDTTTIERLARAYPAASWLTPLGYADLLSKHGVSEVTELDWWESNTDGGPLSFTALPVQHWTNRFGSRPYSRLWCSWSIASPNARVYFAGDSGYCPAFTEIRERMGTFDVALLPIGAYEPRWFMKQAHMNPEDAVQAYLDLGAHHFCAMHWATFRLTDEDPLEPPRRVRAEWQRLALSPERLHIPAIGETLRLAPVATAESAP